MGRAKLNEIGVNLPFLGVSTTWVLSREERQAAWKLLVELVTRVSVSHIGDDEGSDAAALASLHSLFATTRDILKSHGVDTGADRHDGGLAFATVAVRVLNEVVRPFATRWHPLLEAHHAANHEGEPPRPRMAPAEWERTMWGGRGAPLHVEFRRDLTVVRDRLRQFIYVLARAAGTLEFAAAMEAGVTRRGGGPGGDVTALVDTTPNPLPEGVTLRSHMVRWFDPWVAAQSWWKDRAARQSQGDDRDRVPPPGIAYLDYATRPASGPGELWFDYVADMGDAFDPTVQVAWTLGRRELTMRPTSAPEQSVTLPRGEVLVLGGDEIYPYPIPNGYHNQLVAPFTVGFEGPLNPPTVAPPAAPGAVPAPVQGPVPAVVAVPGNHDWYGGLGPWREIFVSGTSLAGWALPQETSWWALRLPHGWWMWGLDTHLSGTINDCQMEHFRRCSQQLQPGDQVILCTPVPMWRLRESAPGRLVVMERFVRDLIEARGAHARLYLSGDAHVFAAYQRTRAGGALETHLTSGGGGAFLQPTHNLAEAVPQTDLGDPDEAALDPAPFTDGTFWPPRTAMHRRLDGRLWQGVRDRQSIGLVALLALLHGLYGALAGVSAHRVTTAAGWAGLLDVGERLVLRWPGSLVTAVTAAVCLLAGVTIAHPNTAERLVRRAARRGGLLHGLAQTAAFVGVGWATQWLAFQLNGDTWSVRAGWLAPLAGAVVGATVSVSLVIAFLLAINRRWRVNDNEAFAAYHGTDGKHFLRFCLTPQRTVRAYLIAIESVRPGWPAAIAGKSLPPGASGVTVAPVRVAAVPWMAEIAPYIPPVRFEPGANRRVAVSASDPEPTGVDDVDDAAKQQLNDLYLTLARTLLTAGFDLAYGGDHRRHGYTEQLAVAAQGTVGFRGGRLHNYLTVTDRRRADPLGGFNIIDVEVEDGPEQRARELSTLRQQMTDECCARIVVGGRLLGASGTAPGILEEAHRFLLKGKPLFVLGGFGGVASAVAAALRSQADPAVLESLRADPGYRQRVAALPGTVPPDTMLRAFEGSTPTTGLSDEHHQRLTQTTDPYEATQLVLNGLRNLAHQDRLH